MSKGRSASQLAGQRFGRLTVIERTTPRGAHNVRWACQCRCGKRLTVLGVSLRSGATRSCGCLRREKSRERMKMSHALSAGVSSHYRAKAAIDAIFGSKPREIDRRPKRWRGARDSAESLAMALGIRPPDVRMKNVVVHLMDKECC